MLVPYAPLLLLLGGLLAGCQRPMAASHHYAAAAPLAAPPARPEMVFLTFKATANAAGPATVRLLHSTVVAGAPKAAPDDAVDAPAYVLVQQLDANRQVLGTVAAEHPLRRAVETAGPDGQLRRQDVRLPEAEFFVRMRLAPQAVTVRVEEFVNRQPVGATDLALPARP